MGYTFKSFDWNKGPIPLNFAKSITSDKNVNNFFVGLKLVQSNVINMT